MDNQSLRDKELVLVQILYIFIIPILLLYYRVIPGSFRLLLLVGVTSLLFGIIHHAHWTHKDLEIKKDFLKDIIPYTIATLVGVVLIVISASLSKTTRVVESYKWWEDLRFLLLFIPISVMQEVIFRGVLMHMLLRAFKNIPFVILVNALLFALIHIIYINVDIVLPLTFLGGIGFAFMYYKYPNLIMISISHTILNFIAMALGLFVLR